MSYNNCMSALCALSVLSLIVCKSTNSTDLTHPHPQKEAPTIEPGTASLASSEQTAPPKSDPAPKSDGTTWSFNDDTPGAPPTGFSFGLTGHGNKGRWEIRAEGDGQVLAQLDTDNTDYRFPCAVADKVQPADIRVSVRCKMLSGEVDRSCGLVARYADENNYYITRANVLENNIRLYYVKQGRRRQIASWRGKVTGSVWHKFRIELRGNHIQVFWDEAQVLDYHDATFRNGGRVGVWTKADSLTYFDDLRVEPL